jgi:hypothetical protein
LWQLAHCGVPAAAAGTRFFLPQFGQATITLYSNVRDRECHSRHRSV